MNYSLRDTQMPGTDIELRKTLTKLESKIFILKFEKYKRTGSIQVFKNATFMTKLTYMGYATEYKDEYDARSADSQ